jgi:hypothetical protein
MSGFSLDSTNSKYCSPSKIRKAWNLNNNLRFLTDLSINADQVFGVDEVQHLNRGLKIVVFSPKNCFGACWQ